MRRRLMNKVYILWHTYELHDDYGTHDEVKLIGVFSTEQKACKTIEMLKDKSGFTDYPIDCFEVSEALIDQPDWTEGFFTYKYTEK